MKARAARGSEKYSPRTAKKTTVKLYDSQARIVPSKRKIMDSLTLTNFNSPIPESVDFNQQSLMQLQMQSSAHGGNSYAAAKAHQQFSKMGG